MLEWHFVIWLNKLLSPKSLLTWITKWIIADISGYDVMKGWGLVSISGCLRFQYHEKVEQKFETTSNHYSRASNTKFLQKMVLKKQNTITIIIIIIIIIIVIIFFVIIINFIIIIIVYRLPLGPSLIEVLWEEENKL